MDYAVLLFADYTVRQYKYSDALIPNNSVEKHCM